ncbi:MAG TPA: hypothetical protein VJ978_07640, partial [Nitriliruptoraceae bacterium]|nr:hypothetical protein [Nitriliruptoraceae bacterium]
VRRTGRLASLTVMSDADVSDDAVTAKRFLRTQALSISGDVHPIDDTDRVRVVRQAMGTPQFDRTNLNETIHVAPGTPLPAGVERTLAQNATFAIGTGTHESSFGLRSPTPGGGGNQQSSLAVEYHLGAVTGTALLFDVAVRAFTGDKSTVELAVRSHADTGGHVAQLTDGPDHVFVTAMPQSWGDSDLTYVVVEALPGTSTTGGWVFIDSLTITGLS